MKYEIDEKNINELRDYINELENVIYNIPDAEIELKQYVRNAIDILWNVYDLIYSSNVYTSNAYNMNDFIECINDRIDFLHQYGRYEI